jgi:Zn-finger nucleic acid-binding protein
VLGNKKQGQKEWISAGTLEKIQERKRMKAEISSSRTHARKAKAQEQYSEANRIVKRSIRADKIIYIEALAAEAEDASQKGNMRELQNIWKEEDISTESGRRATSSSSQRRVTLVPAPTTGG